MTDGPCLPFQHAEQEKTMLTIHDAESQFLGWLAEHPSIAAQVGEEVGLTIYLAGVGQGIKLAMRELSFTPSTRIPESQDFGGIEG